MCIRDRSSSDAEDTTASAEAEEEEDVAGDDEAGFQAEGEENNNLHNPAKVRIRASWHLYLTQIGRSLRQVFNSARCTNL